MMTLQGNGPNDHGHELLRLPLGDDKPGHLHIYEDGWFELTLDVDVAESVTLLTIVACEGNLVDVITA